MAGVDVGTAYLTIVPSAKGFAGKLQGEIGTGMGAAGKRAGADAAAGFGSSFKSGVSTVAKAGALALAGVAAGGVAFLKDSVTEAREAQKVGAITTQIIKSTGGAAKISADQVGDLATAISNKTGVDDEAIQSGANLLLTFKNVKNEVGEGANIFDRATAAAADLSAAGFGDMAGTSKQLGKALNDPIKGISALGRAGVTFTDQQKEQIKTLVKSGKTLDAQKIILKEVESQVGGTAAASATMGEKAAVAFGNLQEQVGTALLPVIDKVSGFLTEKAIPAISDFFKGLQDGTGVGGQVAEKIRLVVDAVKDFITEFQNGEGAGGKFRAVLETIVGIAQNVAKWIGENATVVKALVVAVLAGVGAFQVITGVVKAYTAVQTLLNIVLAANPIGIVVVALAALAAGLIYAYQNSETFRSYVSTAFSVVKIGALELVKVAVTAFQFLANVWLTVVGVLIDGAANAFGWVPGIGPKLQGLQKDFHAFKDSANASLDGIRDDLQVKVDTEKANIALEALHREFLSKGWTVTAEVRTNMVYAGAGQTVPAHASGGPVGPGLHVVGDNPDGSWNKTTELLAINGGGRVYNQSQLKVAPGGSPGLSQSDIDRLAYAISQVRVQAQVSPSALDRTMGAWT